MANATESTKTQEEFAISVFTPWIKGTMDADTHYLSVNLPNTVLFGLIPAGKRKDRSPISGITNMYTNREYKLGKMFFGAVIAFFGFSSIGDSGLMGLLVVALGVLLFLSGIVTTFSYERSGIIKSIQFPFFEANHVESFEEYVSQIVSAHHDDRNVRTHSESNAQSIVNAINNQPK